MKRIAVLFTILIMVFSITACGSDVQEEPAEIEGCEVSMIADSSEIEQGSFTAAAWQSVSKYAAENSLGCEYFKPEAATRKAYLATIDKAVEEGAKLIVLPGNCFEVTAFEAQKAYPETYFFLLDGVPHNDKNDYKASAKTIGVVFAEEEAGYLAGYAAVKDGCTKLGFIGDEKIPAIKRYGYGFIQGAEAAASDDKLKIEVNYEYREPSKAGELASDWYKDGVQVIFACGESMSTPVIKAAESKNGKVIGVDVDQSHLSETVITSAVKGIDAAVENVIDGYADDKFIGGTAFNYAAKNDGVMLEMKNARFSKFNEEQYNSVMDKLKNDKIELKKDKKVKVVTELETEWVTINY